ncbi:MAG: YerC/YecD family TrpR-related protein, partial [Lachnospiraceae bacterium]|nr:YerC/YecD family TrpR-related protein [Lachnospiraceae bacterium]
MSHLSISKTETTDQLFQALLTLENVEECYTFFSDLFTVQEVASFAQRLEVARLLQEGHTYEEIRSQVSVSSATITRINTELQYGSAGDEIFL